MSRPICVNRRGGSVEVAGEILEPLRAPLKIDVWRRVRHPPPDLVHAYSVKSAQDPQPSGMRWSAGHPSALIGKVVSWGWTCEGVPPGGGQWRVRVDVMQDGVSLPGYPAEYAGPLPPGAPLAQLKISEEVREGG